MSEPNADSAGPSDSSSDTSSSDTGADTSGDTSSSGDAQAGSEDDRLIPDERLPDDLNPEKNPLAREPDDDAEGGFSPNTPDGPDPAGGAPG